MSWTEPSLADVAAVAADAAVARDHPATNPPLSSLHPAGATDGATPE
jgi:hypothetical protein